jgi:uncharacterized membrane-anchored protein YhcB (DUF1043 family)
MSHLINEASQHIGNILNRLSSSGRKPKLEMLVLAEKLDNIDERVTSTQRALEKFARAIEVYASHLASHTSAIQELSRSATELRESSAEQNRVLSHITESLFAEKPREESHYVAEPSVSDEASAISGFINVLQKKTAEAKSARYGLQGLFIKDIRERTASAWDAVKSLNALIGFNPVDGCNVKRPINYREMHPGVKWNN